MPEPILTILVASTIIGGLSLLISGTSAKKNIDNCNAMTRAREKEEEKQRKAKQKKQEMKNWIERRYTVDSNPIHFFLLALGIGLVQGGIQALSRSYFTRLIPHNQAGEFFGFYNMVGKFAVIFGPLLMAFVGLLVKQFLLQDGISQQEMESISQIASRWSIGSVLILFIAGSVLFYFVDEEEGKLEIEKYEKNG